MDSEKGYEFSTRFLYLFQIPNIPLQENSQKFSTVYNSINKKVKRGLKTLTIDDEDEKSFIVISNVFVDVWFFVDLGKKN